MNILKEKILLLCSLFTLAFFVGCMPHVLQDRCLAQSTFRDKLVSILNCVAAGIFFSTFFMHMLPEAQESVAAACGFDLKYPIAELVISLGFFFVMFTEQVVVSWYGSQSSDHPEDSVAVKNRQVTRETQPSISLTSSGSGLKYNSLVSDETPPSGNLPAAVGRSETNSLEREDATDDTAIELVDIEAVSTENGVIHRLPASDDHGHTHFDASSHSSVRAYVLLVALSTHALFEGLAIGLQESSSALRTLVVAVSIHKMTLAFSYGLSLVSSKATAKNILLSMIIFSIMAPIGIGGGCLLISLNSTNSEMEKVIAFTQAFASGTFVYIIFIEILPHEFVTSTTGKPIVKVVCLLAGFAMMASFQALPHEEE